MGLLQMKVPSPGESISEVEIAAWLVSEGDYVYKDQAIAEVDSDKATLELPAEESGVIAFQAEEGDVVQVGQVVCTIDTSAEKPKDAPEVKKVDSPTPSIENSSTPEIYSESKKTYATGHPSPAASKLMNEKGFESEDIQGTGRDGRITKQDVINTASSGISGFEPEGRKTSREKMSMLRRKIAQRLVAVKNETAMLTTFNEVDMKPIMDLRKKYKVAFAEKFGVNLGFMSFFTKAVTESLKLVPTVNAQLGDKEIILHEYADIGIAVSSPKGLMVPVVRNAEGMELHEIEADIKRLAIKARDGKITPDEMTGGTFTITNGGVFGSMLSTPIINPPQSAILGMHNIVERPVAIDGKVEIRPIMYVALSYDHRIIDGKESVGFLVNVKELLENPEQMLFASEDPSVMFPNI
ncbi:2-oxoglutarate dehydrogenase complex dihydrolipoyllysine-residue succinyltransferase [Crocinitomicaceae bacterium]|jgi:2-oxoglutarate dehydrogenase E2 component (dihydrolipoamide succinyltransferase)|nr:2-oxoglutarate dehydrogenase complex dihydrolipoyllysine-residue succinyltransferase [Crocinitomicaceae bacterium]MDC0460147.1 2-oxoglutarate dehydrogenase complex dihydrolipoyllysine-residue succinyltransferase [Crocinitomicaceae bacterium]